MESRDVSLDAGDLYGVSQLLLMQKLEKPLTQATHSSTIGSEGIRTQTAF